MYSRLRRLVLTAALLIMPLQGVAATLSPLLCDMQAYANGHQDFGAHHNSGQDDGGASGSSGYHPCQYTVLALLVVAPLPTAPDFPVRAFAPDVLYDPFVPQQPQRPPLV